MFCRQCGNPVVEGSAFCKHCGAPVAKPQPVTNAVPAEAPAPTPVAAPTPAPAPTPVVVAPEPVPVIAAPQTESLETSLVRNVKKHHTGLLFVLALLAYTAMVICTVARPFVEKFDVYDMPKYLLKTELTEFLIIFSDASAIIALVCAIPLIIAMIGAWIFMGQSFSASSRSTAGLTMIKTSFVVRLVAAILALVLVMIVLLTGMTLFDEVVDKVDDYVDQSVSKYQDSLEQYDEYGDATYIADAESAFKEWKDEVDDTLKTVSDVFHVAIIVTLVICVLLLAVPIAHFSCILSSLRSIKDTLKDGIYKPRALGAVDLFNWIMAVVSLVWLVLLLILPSLMEGAIDAVESSFKMSLDLDYDLFTPSVLTVVTLVLNIASYVLFALSISQYDRKQRRTLKAAA